MAFPNSVDGWIVGSNDGASTSRGSFKSVGSGPSGLHRVAYEEVADNGNTLTYRIYHQICLGLTSHIQLGYSVKYTYTINGSSEELYAKDGDTVWNSGPDGNPASQTAKLHYYNLNVSSSDYKYELHSYTDTDKYGSSTNKVWFSTDVTFNKTENGKVRFSLSYAKGKRSGGGSNLGPSSGLRLSVSSFEIDTGKTSYTAPTFSVDSYTQIGKIDSTNYNVNYTINKGSHNIQALNICLLDYHKSSWQTKWEKALSRNSSGTFNDTYQLTSGNGFTSGNRYSMKMYLYDGTTEILRPGSGFKTSDAATIYTYQEPKINTSITIANNPQNANMSNTFTLSGINNRKWTSFEAEFQTHYRIKKGSAAYTSWANLGNVSSWTRSASQIRSLVSKTYDADPIIIQFRRYNSSASWYSDNNAQGTFYVYYRPRVGIGNANYRKNNSSGSTINANSWVLDDSSLSSIYVSWSYNTSIANAGYTQGYRIRLYNSSQTVVKTYYTANKYYSIPKADIPRLQQTYIDITPYYQNDTTNTANYWYYNGTISKINFIKIYGNLSKPVIEYPVNNSNWINNLFRVAFKLPSDPDYKAITGTYKYRNLELQINNNYTIRMADTEGITTSGTTIKDEICFSCNVDDLTYQRAIVSCPYHTLSLPESNIYTLRLRVQKNYGTYKWSEWSDPISFTITSVPSRSYTNQLILASHYNEMRDTINRMINTYGVTWPNDPKAASNTIIIDKDRYSYNNVLDRLNAIKTKINNYAVFEEGTNNNNMNKFDFFNELPTSFNVKEELITDEEVESNGANYLITILKRCNLLQ